MDPKACLEEASDAVEQCRFREAGDRLKSYFSWRVGGGFEPKSVRNILDGDDYYRHLVARVCRSAGMMHDSNFGGAGR